MITCHACLQNKESLGIAIDVAKTLTPPFTVSMEGKSGVRSQACQLHVWMANPTPLIKVPVVNIHIFQQDLALNLVRSVGTRNIYCSGTQQYHFLLQCIKNDSAMNCSYYDNWMPLASFSSQSLLLWFIINTSYYVVDTHSTSLWMSNSAQNSIVPKR